MMQMIKYLIYQYEYNNHKEFWVQKSIRLLWIHIYWENTTIAYYSKFEQARKAYNDLTGKDCSERTPHIWINKRTVMNTNY